MSQMPSLDGSALDLTSLREAAKNEIVQILESIDGPKALIFDPRIAGQLSLVAPTAMYKQYGVDSFHFLSLDPRPIESMKIIFLARPTADVARQIAAQIRFDSSERVKKQYFAFFLPRVTIVCEKVLEAEGVHSDIVIGECDVDLIPADKDILSLEIDSSYKECQVDGNRSSLFLMAKAISKLQDRFGVIPLVKGVGKSAILVSEMLPRMRREQPVLADQPSTSAIDMCVLIDRQVDMVTPFCTQLTYEGLLDEFLKVNNGVVEVDPAIVGSDRNGRKVKIPLNSSDNLFRELRDVNFGAVGKILKLRTDNMKEDYTEVKVTGQKQSVSDLKDFVKKLDVLPELTRHVNLAHHLRTVSQRPSFLAQLGMEQTIIEGKNFDGVMDYLEECINRQNPIIAVLRLLSLLSVTNGGLPKKNFDFVRREILQSYGFEHLFTLDNLENAGLLKRQDNRLNWQTIQRALRLVVDDLDDASPNDIAYTYSGYAPISIRLVQSLFSKGGWKNVEEALKLLNGPFFERRQSSDGTKYVNEAAMAPIRKDRSTKPLVLVVFLGGVTYAEISALRFLSSQGAGVDFVVATTKLISGNSLMESMIEDPSKLSHPRVLPQTVSGVRPGRF